MSYLVDTNVFSEKLKPRSDAKVVAWLAENESELFISTLTIAEIRRGIERLPQGKRRDQFQQWLTALSQTMAGSILSFNRDAAHSWGQMQGQLDLLRASEYHRSTASLPPQRSDTASPW